MKKKLMRKSELKKFIVINARYIVLAMILLLVLGSLALGELLNFYEKLWWWDDMLHTVAGFVLGIVGFLLAYLFNAGSKLNISPLLVAIFAFSFAISMSVLWEMIEFTADVFFGTNMQRWQLPPEAVLIGKAYQGTGLRDTMSDLIVAWIGASGAAVSAFLAFKYKRPAAQGIMRRTFPWLGGKNS